VVWVLADGVDEVDGVDGGRATVSLEEGGVDRKAGEAAWRVERGKRVARSRQDWAIFLRERGRCGGIDWIGGRFNLIIGIRRI